MKWQLLSYKQKIRVFGAGAFVLLLLCYQYGFKNTWQIYGEYTKNKKRTAELGNYATLLPVLQKEEKKVNDLINTNLSDTANIHRATLAFITAFCKSNQLKLTDYQPVQLSENSSFKIATRVITVEGNYSGLLKMLFEIETNQSFGKLCSASFKSIEDISDGAITLSVTFYLQNLIRK